MKERYMLDYYVANYVDALRGDTHPQVFGAVSFDTLEDISKWAKTYLQKSDYIIKIIDTKSNICIYKHSNN